MPSARAVVTSAWASSVRSRASLAATVPPRKSMIPSRSPTGTRWRSSICPWAMPAACTCSTTSHTCAGDSSVHASGRSSSGWPRARITRRTSLACGGAGGHDGLGRDAGLRSEEGEECLVLDLAQPVEGRRRARVAVPDRPPRAGGQLGVVGVATEDLHHEVAAVGIHRVDDEEPRRLAVRRTQRADVDAQLGERDAHVAEGRAPAAGTDQQVHDGGGQEPGEPSRHRRPRRGAVDERRGQHQRHDQPPAHPSEPDGSGGARRWRGPPRASSGGSRGTTAIRVGSLPTRRHRASRRARRVRRAARRPTARTAPATRSATTAQRRRTSAMTTTMTVQTMPTSRTSCQSGSSAAGTASMNVARSRSKPAGGWAARLKPSSAKPDGEQRRGGPRRVAPAAGGRRR